MRQSLTDNFLGLHKNRNSAFPLKFSLLGLSIPENQAAIMPFPITLPEPHVGVT